jgi:hypothetical protein
MSVFSQSSHRPARNRNFASSTTRLRAAVEKARPARSTFEPLEVRQLMAVDVGVAAGVLTITGTNDPETIAINPAITSPYETATRWSVSAKDKFGVVTNTTIDNVSSITKIVVNGNAGDDTIRISDWIYTAARIDGGAGNDYIAGGGGADNIVAGDGADSVYGQSGNDIIDGGDGVAQDYLLNDDGDLLDGGPGSDRLYAARWGPSQLNGGTGNDSLYGGTANDVLNGQAGADYLFGYDGNDRLDGGADNDSIYGSNGNDSLFAGAGDDLLCGDAGDDTLVSIGGGQRDALTGGTGFDSFWGDAETTEQFLDADTAERAAGNCHRVDRFVQYFNQTPITVTRELDGQNFADPAAPTAFTNCRATPLFSTGGPSMNDINQGALGNCGVMSTLSAIARANPNKIHQTVVDLGDGTFGVQLFEDPTDDARANGTPVFIRLDADLPLQTCSRFNTTQPSLWVQLVEKAFAYFHTKSGAYTATEGCEAYQAFRYMGADWSNWWYSNPSVIGVPRNDAGVPRNAESLRALMKQELDAGRAVVFATLTANLNKGPLISQHYYVVDAINADGTIRLRNPHGQAAAGGGYVTITAAEAFASYASLQSGAV